jgi:UDP-2,3-diacylglucosamine pyrophosphatase LpxH
VAAKVTRSHGCEGVICGHIHRPAIKTIDGILYANDGDWVESLSYLTEQHDGALALHLPRPQHRSQALPHAEVTRPLLQP